MTGMLRSQVRVWLIASVIMPVLVTAAREAEGGGLRGYVFGLNEDGRFAGPIAGATVEFLAPGGAVVARATTNESGYYQVDLAPGVYAYRVAAEGYRPDNDGRKLVVEDPDRYTLRNFALRPGPSQEEKRPEHSGARPAVLQGHVYELSEGKRAGVPGATVVVRPDGTDQALRVRTTGSGDAPGAYRILLAPGNYTVVATASGYATSETHHVELKPGDTKQVDFVLRKLDRKQGVLSVTPRLEGNRGVPVPGPVQIWIRQLAPVRNARGPFAGAVGSASRFELPAGQFVVIGSAAGGEFVGATETVELRAGQHVNVELLLQRRKTGEPAGALTVRVRDPRGLPVAQARVLLRREGAPLAQARTASTDQSGQARFTDLEPGTYQVLAQIEGFRPAGATVQLPRAASREVELVLGTAPQRPETRLALVSGWVVYPDRRSRTGYFGVAGARIVWTPIGERGSATEVASGEDGSFRVELPPGRYRVLVIPPGQQLEGTEETVDVPPTGVQRKFFVLKPAAEPRPAMVTVRGYVRERLSGQIGGAPGLIIGQTRPVAGTVLQWAPADGRSGTTATTTSDPLGAFVVTLPAGTYLVEVRPPAGYMPTRLQVSVTPGMPPVVIEVQRLGLEPFPEQPGLSVIEVVQSLGPFLPAFRPVANAKVIIYRGDRPVAQGTTDAAGRFQTRLPDGIYRVTAATEGTQGTAILVVRGGGRTQVVLQSRGEAPQETPDQTGEAVPVAITVLRPVVDSSGRRRTEPVAGATVLIRTGGEIITRGQTDKSGTYTTRLKPGRYLVVARHERFGAATANIVVGTRPLRRSILLQPVQTAPGEFTPLQSVPRLNPQLR